MLSKEQIEEKIKRYQELQRKARVFGNHEEYFVYNTLINELNEVLNDR